METVVHLPESEPPCTIREVLDALDSQKLSPRHEKKSWGDWIHLEDYRTVISIESMRGLTRSATIEASDEDTEDPTPSILKAFGKLGWYGIDEDGEFPLD
jgi:hypothetical protein